MASKVKKVSNWASLATKIGSDPSNAAKKRKRQEVEEKEQESKHQSKTSKTKGSLPENVPEHVKSKYIGLDCEMVGIGLTGKQSALARCCCVNFDGEVIYDKFVRPQSFVTDFRTQWSGVRKRDLRQGEAIPLAECQQDVANLLQDKILVGHALKNDLSVLMLSHRKNMIRDTASWKPYMRPHGRKGGKFKPRALRDLTLQFLGKKIQDGEHDPGVDARSAMELYRLRRDEWEKDLKERRSMAIKASMEKQRSLNDGDSLAVATKKAVASITTKSSSSVATGSSADDADADDDDDSGDDNDYHAGDNSIPVPVATTGRIRDRAAADKKFRSGGSDTSSGRNKGKKSKDGKSQQKNLFGAAETVSKTKLRSIADIDRENASKMGGGVKKLMKSNKK